MDLAGETGGNCELSEFGTEVVSGGVTIMAPTNLPSMLPWHASLMYSRNVQTLLEYLVVDGALKCSLEDPIAGPMCVTHDGQVRYGRAS
jgi:NAD(P) transhydrogenase subunit alpha